MRYLFIGWDNSEKNGKKHDKIWGISATDVRHGLPAYVFYGRRGKTLAVKQHEQGWDLNTLRTNKERKGYREIHKDMLAEIWPDIEQQLEEQITVCALSGNKYSAIE